MKRFDWKTVGKALEGTLEEKDVVLEDVRELEVGDILNSPGWGSTWPYVMQVTGKEGPDDVHLAMVSVHLFKGRRRGELLAWSPKVRK